MNKITEARMLGSIVPAPSTDSAFLWGQSQWGKDNTIENASGVIKVTLHQYGITQPILPFGFIIEIAKGGILRAFDWEVTDFSPIVGRKFQYLGLFSEHRVYKEDEMPEMLSRTTAHGANEIWVDGDKTRIIGAYIYRDNHSRGRTVFKFMMRKAGIPLCLMY